MTRVESFPPIARADARALVLGSMPSERSLREGRYYGHPRNAFWWIMGELFAAGPDVPYPERGRRLAERGVALWDVLRACVRPGSLDGSIVRASEEPNDLAAFLAAHPAIATVFFNGAKAEEAWRRHVTPRLALGRPLRFERLPSTSPAHASLSWEAKLARWGAVQRAAEPPPRAPR
jgi:hypoxanthine-DNA glycosylase